jgi:CheY-like chemotaxis protein
MSGTSPAGAMLRLLVVEDSATQAIVLRQRLMRSGFEVRLAHNGREALTEIERERPTLVLTDLDMPVMNGLELVEELRRRNYGVPVILLTAQGSEEVAVRALRAGAAAYVPKRALDRDLPRTMERVLALCRSGSGQLELDSVLLATGSEYELPNDPALVSPLVSRLQHKLGWLRGFDANSLTRIGIAVHEALVNAMEHGNLAADSALREQDDGAYRRQIAERRVQEPYASRRVRLRSSESRTEIKYVIRDEGPGFDPASLPDPTDPANLERSSGRGLLLIRSFMDEVSFNATGNEITLVKHHVQGNPD